MAYHHGNARQALLDATAELLERDGAARLSLRQVAERAALSRQAPYNHFVSKEALLAELVREGFERLSREMTGSPDASPSDRLAAAAKSYIAFGEDRPALFRLMFGRELVDIDHHPAARKAASSALQCLSEAIAMFGPTAPDDATLVAWSLVHGYTSLCIETGLEGPPDRDRRAALFARAVEALIRDFVL